MWVAKTGGMPGRLKVAAGDAIESLGESAEEKDEGGGLGIGFGADLLAFFEGAFVDALFTGEDSAGGRM